jgi:hypothetical protein
VKLSEGYPVRLKGERLRWYPDRFSRCKEELRDEFCGKATEVFVVLDRLYNDGREES